METRIHVKPSREEAAADNAWTAVRDSKVYADRDIPPFTRVAVCTGRLYTDMEHTRVFGENDAWGQWTVQKVPQRGSLHRFKIEQGYIVSPGLPTGDIDPLFLDISTYGCSPYFAPSLVEQETWCVQVVNAKKGRMEYWVGRRGAKAGQLLTLCYGDVRETLAFPTLYVLYGHYTRPVSVFELARFQTGLEPYSILTQYLGEKVFTPNGRVTKKVQEWAKHYDPMKEHVEPTNLMLPSSFQLNRPWENSYGTMKKAHNLQSHNLYYQLKYRVPKMKVGYKAVFNDGSAMPVMPLRVRHVFEKASQRRLGKLIQQACAAGISLSDTAAAAHLIKKMARFYDIKPYTLFKRKAYRHAPTYTYLMISLLHALITHPEFVVELLQRSTRAKQLFHQVLKHYDLQQIAPLTVENAGTFVAEVMENVFPSICKKLAARQQ
jgi:hypothetical protein